MSNAYPGGELELFSGADHWKSYIGDVLRPFVRGRVLDVGGGIGANVPVLNNERVTSWISAEPDSGLARQAATRIAGDEYGARGGLVVCGTLDAIAPARSFDTILYIDVLEHIADDRAELIEARRRLAPSGHLVVLAPAHPFLFSPFDRAIGHYRRYRRAALLALAPPGCRLVLCRMLDSAGFFASLANRVVLSSAMPSPRQVAVWDRLLVPLSRRVDPVLGHRFGKTVVAVWQALPE